jgi:hypothetical protein
MFLILAALGKLLGRPDLKKKKKKSQKGLVEWLKVQALSSSPSTTNNK